MLVRRRGPRRIPGPRRPHPCGKDIMTFSLADFMGYCMSVISAIEDNLFAVSLYRAAERGCSHGSSTYFLDFGRGECGWLLHLQMVRPE